MRAMILAAGLGTRLMPLTRQRPKCLMPVMNRPLLGLWLDRLAEAGVERAVVNTHHHAEMVHGFLAEPDRAWPEVRVSREPVILDTGGGMVAAREALGDDPFLLIHADVICTADLAGLYRRHLASGAVATLGLIDDPRFNTVAVDRADGVIGFRDDPETAQAAGRLTFAGVAVISPELLDFLPPDGPSCQLDAYRGAIKAGQTVAGARLGGFWDDLGRPEALLDLHLRLAHRLAGGPPDGLAHLAPRGPVVLGPGAVVDPAARLEGLVVLGAGAVVEAGARVTDSLLLDGARVAAGAEVSGAVLGDGYLADGKIKGGAYA